MKEKLTLIFMKNGESFTYNWGIRKGLRGARDANKIRKLQQVWGDPVEIIGDGPTANLLRREYVIYNNAREHYEGVPIRDILKAGAQITGVPVESLQKISRKIRSKLS